jgi:hypothetical protein
VVGGWGVHTFSGPGTFSGRALTARRSSRTFFSAAKLSRPRVASIRFSSST